MNRSGNPLLDAMSALAREELKGTEHPSTANLLAYQRGEISPPQAAAIREHLSLCEACAALVLDAAHFFGDEEEEKEATPADLEAAWQELRATSHPTEQRLPSPAPALTPLPPRRRSLLRSPALAYALAAVFAGLSLGLLFFRGASPPPRPQANVELYDLTPNAERGEAAEVKSIRFQSPEGSALLILNPSIQESSPRHGVRIRREDRVVVWRSEDLVPQAQGGFHVSLPAGALRPGRYSLELYGIAGSGETSLGTYQILIER
jgi:hypothetical protein